MLNLRREKGVLNLTLEEDETSVGQVDTPEDVDSPPAICLGIDSSDPRLLILSSAIMDMLSTSLSELNTTISLLATNFQTFSQKFSPMQPSPRYRGGCSPSSRYREGTVSITTAASAFDRPTAGTGITHLPHHSDHDSTASEEVREVGSDQHGIPDDALSIQAYGNEDEIGENPISTSRFTTFCQDVVQNKAQLAPPLPADISTCFNDIYHSDLSKSTVLTDLLDTVHRPGNIDLDVIPTNPGVYNLKKPNMPALRSQDAKLQSSQKTLAKANYMIMQSAATLETSRRAKEVSDKIVGDVLDSCIHAVTLSTWAVQQFDQVR